MRKLNFSAVSYWTVWFFIHWRPAGCLDLCQRLATLPRPPAGGSMMRGGFSIERDADPFFLAPYHAAEEVRAIREQGEMRGDADRAGDVESRARG
jgi:hypothetical protein